MVDLPGGTFAMGDDSVWAYPDDGESPVHDVHVAAFRIDRYAVTNARFAEFVAATGFRTDAETYGWSFVFGGFLPDDFPDTRCGGRPRRGGDRCTAPTGHIPMGHAPASPTGTIIPWCTCRGTTRRPSARGRARACRPNPNGSTPRAAVGANTSFPWGDDLEPGGEHRMNVFQGRFPGENTGADGYVATAPVDAFPPNGFGLHNVTGNVWEWCADWYDPTSYTLGRAREPDRPYGR